MNSVLVDCNSIPNASGPNKYMKNREAKSRGRFRAWVGRKQSNAEYLASLTKRLLPTGALVIRSVNRVLTYYITGHQLIALLSTFSSFYCTCEATSWFEQNIIRKAPIMRDCGYGSYIWYTCNWKNPTEIYFPNSASLEWKICKRVASFMTWFCVAGNFGRDGTTAQNCRDPHCRTRKEHFYWSKLGIFLL